MSTSASFFSARFPIVGYQARLRSLMVDAPSTADAIAKVKQCKITIRLMESIGFLENIGSVGLQSMGRALVLERWGLLRCCRGSYGIPSASAFVKKTDQLGAHCTSHDDFAPSRPTKNAQVKIYCTTRISTSSDRTTLTRVNRRIEQCERQQYKYKTKEKPRRLEALLKPEQSGGRCIDELASNA